jgi:DNA-binding NtrC family response regulator
MAKIFLIDDDFDLITQNKMILEKRGHTIITAPTAKDAISMLSTNKPDIFVVDVMMEHHRAGFEFTREVNKTYPDLPLIIVSGDTHKENWQSESPDTWTHIRRFVEKPINANKLADIIEEVLNEK